MKIKKKHTKKKYNPEYFYSTEVPWDLDREEGFRFGKDLPSNLKPFERKSYNISKAKEILSEYPYIIKKINIEKYFKYTDYFTKNYNSLITLDFNIPIILISLNNKKFPIDGWNRILRAKFSEIKELPAIQLTEKISENIRFKI